MTALARTCPQEGCGRQTTDPVTTVQGLIDELRVALNRGISDHTDWMAADSRLTHIALVARKHGLTDIPRSAA